MVRLVSVIFLFLCGCNAGKVVQIEPPNDPNTHVIGYQTLPVFTGVELTLGIPALGFVPLIGPSLAEAIKLKAGNTTTLLVPIIAEDKNEVNRLGSSHITFRGRPWVQVNPPGSNR